MKRAFVGILVLLVGLSGYCMGGEPPKNIEIEQAIEKLLPKGSQEEKRILAETLIENESETARCYPKPVLLVDTDGTKSKVFIDTLAKLFRTSKGEKGLRILIVDRLDKASEQFQDRMIALLDTGYVDQATPNQRDFRNTVMVFSVTHEGLERFEEQNYRLYARISRKVIKLD